jgi:hypothetical protein
MFLSLNPPVCSSPVLDLAFAFSVYEKNKNGTDQQKILIEGAN